MDDRKPIGPEIPVEVAWQTKRRIYVRSGMKSQLNADLVELGAKWDRDVRARWVGSTKRERVLELVRAAMLRRQAIEDIKALNLWLPIPVAAEDVRAAAKEAGAIFDGDRKAWAFRDTSSLMAVTELRDRWITEVDEAKRLERAELEREDAELAAAERVRAGVDAAARRAELLAGRDTTGETDTIVEVSTRRMNKATAEQFARPLGAVVKLHDGRRGVVVSRKIWFSGSEEASSTCWHPETHDQAHWDLRYEVAIVAATPQETAADAAEQAERQDATTVADLVDSIQASPGPVVDRMTAIPDKERVGTIEVSSGMGTYIPAGTLTLTVDGRVVWQHPGFYDTWDATERILTDPELVAAVRRVLAGGTRELGRPGRSTNRFRITAP